MLRIVSAPGLNCLWCGCRDSMRTHRCCARGQRASRWMLKQVQYDRLKIQHQLGDWGEAPAMERRWAEAGERIAMIGRAIALVAGPAIARMLKVIGDHHGIPLMLGDDRGSRDRKAERIAVHHRTRLIAPARQGVAVDEHVARLGCQRLDRARHRQHRRPKDIELIDLLNGGDAEANLRLQPDLAAQIGPALGAELLAVVDPLRHPPPVEDHRRRYDRAGKWPPARLVDADDGHDMLLLDREAGRHQASSSSTQLGTSSLAGPSRVSSKKMLPSEGSRLSSSVRAPR